MNELVLVLCMLSVGNVQTLFNVERWIKQSPVHFINLSLWKEVSSVSRLDCVRKCQHASCSGCGYHTDDNKCFLYLDWNNRTAWKPLSRVIYYVPESGGLPEEWSDMRMYGQPFAMLIANMKKQWLDAKEFCIRLGGTLLIMDSTERRQAIQDELKRQVNNTKTQKFWVGLTDMEVNGQWYWSNGNPGLSPNFFIPTQPSNSGGNEHCAELAWSTLKEEALLNDLSCQHKRKCICQFTLFL